jgi:hypothetical protein
MASASFSAASTASFNSAATGKELKVSKSSNLVVTSVTRVAGNAATGKELKAGPGASSSAVAAKVRAATGKELKVGDHLKLSATRALKLLEQQQLGKN